MNKNYLLVPLLVLGAISSALADGYSDLEAIRAKNKTCVAKLAYAQQLSCFQQGETSVQKILDLNRAKLKDPQRSKFVAANASIIAACNGLATPGYKSAAVAIAECRYNNKFDVAWFLQN